VGIDYSTSIYLPNYNLYARAIVVTPIASQPNVAAYSNRGIYNTEKLDVAAEDGSIVTEHRTYIDVREIEFDVVPIQGDQVFIPADRGAMGELGNFEVIDAWHNGGGETTLQLRAIKTVG
jgi:hypothetical protein